MKILDPGMKSEADEKQCPKFITTYDEFQKLKHTSACIYKDRYEAFLDMDSDDVFVRPTKIAPQPQEKPVFDPFTEINAKNTLLADLKSKNLVYRKDPTYLPVTVQQTVVPILLDGTPEAIVAEAFNKDKCR